MTDTAPNNGLPPLHLEIDVPWIEHEEHGNILLLQGGHDTLTLAHNGRTAAIYSSVRGINPEYPLDKWATIAELTVTAQPGVTGVFDPAVIVDATELATGVYIDWSMQARQLPEAEAQELAQVYLPEAQRVWREGVLRACLGAMAATGPNRAQRRKAGRCR